MSSNSFSIHLAYQFRKIYPFFQMKHTYLPCICSSWPWNSISGQNRNHHFTDILSFSQQSSVLISSFHLWNERTYSLGKTEWLFNHWWDLYCLPSKFVIFKNKSDSLNIWFQSTIKFFSFRCYWKQWKFYISLNIYGIKCETTFLFKVFSLVKSVIPAI